MNAQSHYHQSDTSVTNTLIEISRRMTNTGKKDTEMKKKIKTKPKHRRKTSKKKPTLCLHHFKIGPNFKNPVGSIFLDTEICIILYIMKYRNCNISEIVCTSEYKNEKVVFRTDIPRLK